MPRVDVDGNLTARIGLNFFLSASSRRTHSFAQARNWETASHSGVPGVKPRYESFIILYQIGGHEYVPPIVLGQMQTGLLPIVGLILHGAMHPFLL